MSKKCNLGTGLRVVLYNLLVLMTENKIIIIVSDSYLFSIREPWLFPSAYLEPHSFSLIHTLHVSFPL